MRRCGYFWMPRGFKDLETRRHKDVKVPCCEDARLSTCPPLSTILYLNAWIHTSFMLNLFSKVAMFFNLARICYVSAQITWFVVVLHCNLCFSLYTNLIFVLIDIYTFLSAEIITPSEVAACNDCRYQLIFS